MKNDKLLHKWINGTLSPKEQKEFEQRPEFTELEKIHRGTELLGGPDLNEDAVLTNILKKGKTASPKMPGTLRRLLPYAAAAAVLLLIGFFVLRPPAPTTYMTNFGEQLTVMLPDESSFSLNADSELTFQENKWPTQRTLQLSGEAFFSVAEGNTFTVETPQGAVVVAGTRFNVLSRGNLLEVSCFSGKVIVEYLLRELKTELVAGEAIRFTPQSDPLTWSLAAAEKQAGWLEGITQLRSVPLQYAMEELERQFGLQIKPNNVNTQRVVTVNFQHQNLEDALRTVFRPLNIRYVLKSDQQVNLFQE